MVQSNTQLQGELEKSQAQQIELLQSTIADSVKAQEITESKEREIEQLKRDLECKAKEIEELKSQVDKIAALTTERDYIRKRLSGAEEMVVKLEEDNKCAHDLVLEQARTIQEGGKVISGLQNQCKQLKEDVEHWKGQSSVDEHAMKSLEVKVNMQRQVSWRELIQVKSVSFSLTSPTFGFLRCLPAHRGQDKPPEYSREAPPGQRYESDPIH